jgi:molecular chaperone Hsp33
MAAADRDVSDVARDDIVTPFTVEGLSTRGRVARLGPTLDAILKRHDYPPAVGRVVAEAATLAVLLGASLKEQGRFQLQTQSDGPVGMVLVDFDAPSNLRALARFDATALEARLAVSGDRGDLLGKGYLAFTIEPDGLSSRYQGVVELNGRGLEDAAHQYFERSEQIPTLARIAVGQMLTAEGPSWRAGGLIAQFLPESEERRRRADLDPGDAPPGHVAHEAPEDDSWTEAKSLAATTEDHELLDPSLSSERLLYRLFHERGVRVFGPSALADVCRCSADRIDSMLQSFSDAERQAMVGDDGMIGVTCEFCSVKRIFDPRDYSK